MVFLYIEPGKTIFKINNHYENLLPLPINISPRHHSPGG